MHGALIFVLSFVIFISPSTAVWRKVASTDANITLHTYIEQRAATIACRHQAGLTCSALLFAEGEQASHHRTVSAGFLIFTDNNSPLVPDNLSRRSVAQTSIPDAFLMAHTLVTTLVNSDPAALCGVTAMEIASAIWHAARIASECPDTDDPVCFPFYKLRVCDIPHTQM